MSQGTDHRLTDNEHGTLNVALNWYADEIEDPSEAQDVRKLAESIICSDVYLYSRRGNPRPISLGACELREHINEKYKGNDND